MLQFLPQVGHFLMITFFFFLMVKIQLLFKRFSATREQKMLFSDPAVATLLNQNPDLLQSSSPKPAADLPYLTKMFVYLQMDW